MKKPDINIADILKRLSFLKNNLGLLVPIVIAIVALLLLIPTRILRGQLRATVQNNSVKIGQQIDSLKKRVGDATSADVMDDYIKAYRRDVNEIDTMMAHTVYRELLRYDVFRDANETSRWPFEQFGQTYRAGVEAMIDSLDAGVCPTDTEIETALESAPRLGLGLGRGDRSLRRPMYSNRGGVSWSRQTMSDVERGIFEEICTGKARAYKVYASPANVVGYASWNEWKFENRDQALKECWYWQLGYWAIEDVITTIRTMNEDYGSIIEAPVKRLINVSFQLEQAGMMASPGRRSRRRKEQEYPTYVKDKTEALTTPCTGRFTDETSEMDVIHFEVRVVVDESQVLPFIRQLCSAKEHKFYGFDGTQPEQTYQHNQITVLETSVAPIDPVHFAHQTYRYGSNPAAELHLICEYALPRVPAFEEIKPLPVKKELSGEEEDEDY